MNEAKRTFQEGLGLAEAFRVLSVRLANAGVEQAEAEARRMLLASTHLAHAALISQPTRAITPEEAQTLQSWLDRRLAGEPVTRIIGQREFWTLNLRVARDDLRLHCVPWRQKICGNFCFHISKLIHANCLHRG